MGNFFYIVFAVNQIIYRNLIIGILRSYSRYVFLFVLVFSIFSFVGCATGLKYGEISNQIPDLKIGEGRIFFYRQALPPPLFQPRIAINGIDVGKAVPGGVFSVDLPEGTYEVGNRKDSVVGFSFLNSQKIEPRSKKIFSLSAGQIRFIEMIPTPHQESPLSPIIPYIRMILVEPNEGEKVIQELKYIKPDNNFCEKECQILFEKGKLKEGMTEEECIKTLCSGTPSQITK